MENNLSNNINNVDNNFISVDEDFVLMNKDVHDRSEPDNEGVTKDVDLGNMSLLNEDIMLKYSCQIKIALERMLTKEALISEEDVQLLEEVIMKGINKALMCGVDFSDNTVEHVIH